MPASFPLVCRFSLQVAMSVSLYVGRHQQRRDTAPLPLPSPLLSTQYPEIVVFPYAFQYRCHRLQRNTIIQYYNKEYSSGVLYKTHTMTQKKRGFLEYVCFNVAFQCHHQGPYSKTGKQLFIKVSIKYYITLYYSNIVVH